MTENNIPTCERCGTPMTPDPSHYDIACCPLDPKDCRIKELERQLEEAKANALIEEAKATARDNAAWFKALHFDLGKALGMMYEADGHNDEPAPVQELLDAVKRNESQLRAAESRAQEAETKLRAAEDAVVVLREALTGALLRVAHEQYCKPTPGNECTCEQWEFVFDCREALSNTSALAAQRKREIQREALEQAWKRVEGIDWNTVDDLDKLDIRAAILNPEGHDANTEGA